MAGIFISYRRGVTSGDAGRLYDVLSDRFGKRLVFYDVSINPGDNWVTQIGEHLKQADVLIAIIGQQWLDSLNNHFPISKDYLRLEIATALQEKIPIIPVLVNNAQMPDSRNLPPDLQGFDHYQYHRLSAESDQSYKDNAKHLVETVREMVPSFHNETELIKVEAIFSRSNLLDEVAGYVTITSLNFIFEPKILNVTSTDSFKIPLHKIEGLEKVQRMLTIGKGLDLLTKYGQAYKFRRVDKIDEVFNLIRDRIELC